MNKITNNAQVWLPNINKNSPTPKEAHAQFSSYLNNALSEVNKAQHQSNEATIRLVNNDGIELHEVLITQQKASVMLQTTLEVRNKAIEAYQEVMRMQV
ncbi:MULTISPECIES: flagellar hook-basal body complex protein FliE [Bacillus]|uniref:flagellar hook-basal body complex protein FliE n=1 Tax=Bacillus TaxID=1386 RepID=UPI000BB96BF1|nr:MULTISPECIES: flagellar hook-basal body complex protein FliE [Bacillus]